MAIFFILYVPVTVDGENRPVQAAARRDCNAFKTFHLMLVIYEIYVIFHLQNFRSFAEEERNPLGRFQGI